MAKIKRTIRKLPPVAQTPVEEQLWPLYVALLLFGGLLAGVALAYLRFDDPVWYRNALLWLLVVPVAVSAAMVALYFVNTRVMRRGVQLAMVLSLLAHFLIFWQMYYLRILGPNTNKAKKVVAKNPEPRQIRISVERPVPKPQQRDFEKPVETPEPEKPKSEEIDKQQLEPDPQETPEAPQPTPQEQPQPTPTPAVTQKTDAGQTVPRFSEIASKLSRQTSKATPTTNRSAEAPQVASQTERSETKPDVTVAKSATNAQAEVKQPSADPTTPQPTPNTQVARRDMQQPQPEAPTTPTLAKTNTRPSLAPAALAQVETPSRTKATDPSEVTPRTISPDKRATASPEVAQAKTEPAPETPSEVKPEVVRRRTQAEEKPTLATAQESVPNPRPRETTRPSVTTLAATTATAETPQQSAQTDATPRPSATQVAKAAPTPTTTQSAQTANTPEPTTSPTPATASLAKRSATAAPTEATETAAITSPQKAKTQAGAPSSASATPIQVAAASSSADDGALSPTSVAVRKQATESPESAPAGGAPSAAAVAGTTASATASLSSRRESADNAATPTDNPQFAAAGKSSTKTALNVNSAADTSASQTGASVAADATIVGPSSAQIARQQTNSPSATSSRQPLEAESLSPSTASASAGSNRAALASLPTINPTTLPNASPQRTARAAQEIASPTNVESPSLAATATGQGEPSAQPARMALTKSLAGVAGVGQSPNLDRSQPAADSPAMIASGSARREAATQDSPDGPALSPSSTAIAGRSRATANAPSSTLKAQDLPNASQAGSQQIASIDAAAGASLQKQASNAERGAVSASPGQVEVDIGPTQTIADSGASSRASGGGQPTINTETQAKQLARREVGGSAAAALATNTKADEPTAPAGTGGGAPKSLDVNTEATAIARTQAGGASPVTGGPATATQRGPATEVSAAALVGAAALAKNDNATPGGAPQAAGTPSTSTSASAPRVARASGGAPQLAIGGPVTAQIPNIPQGDGGAPASAAAAPAVAGVAKDGGASGATASAPAAAEIATASSGGVIATANAGRAEAVEASPGAPAVGGGNAASRPRSSSGPALAANTRADAPAISGATTSGGMQDGAPVASAGVEVTKSGGAKSAGAVGTAAAVAAGEPSDAVGSGAPGTAVAARASDSQADGPVAVASSGTGSPGRRAPQTAVPGGTTTTAAVLSNNPGTLATATGDSPLTGMERGQMTRQEVTGAIPVPIGAEEGPGGLGDEVALDVGINSRRASSESLDVQVKDSRFIRQKVGGDLSINTGAIVATDGFRRRGPDGRGGGGSASPQTEETIELGLVYLAKHQLDDGSWSLQGHDPGGAEMLASDTAATALAILAFQGAGYSHREHKYKDVVNGGIQFLLKNQQKNGDLFMKADERSNSSAWLYSHALATLALCEAYGMTGDPELRDAAQRSVDFIVKSQNKERGGWRYVPQAGSDTSVTGWMMMALKSAEMANLDVPADTYAKIRKWLDVSHGGEGKQHLYRYDPWANDTPTQRHGRSVSKTMTSVGLLMRLYLGTSKTSVEMQRGGEYLLANPPQVGTVRPRLIVETPRDTYYWYYSTQVMWHLGGDYWQRWQAQIHPLLLRSQIQQGPYAGSWDPINPVPDRWGPTAGRLYVTTLNLLSLEVQYRYLPIYESK